jgi:GNAT superfamily N-acetyltransferase
MSQDVLRDLGGGLILRHATVDDTEELVAFHADVHRDPGQEEPEQYVGAWVRDLMKGTHPTFSPGDFTLVEDTHSGEIVSSLCLISQTWSYGGVEFGVGRPELVATRPDHRRRGLIRAQFEVIHQWSARRGEQVQAITGIPWYYRQFGYEMAMTLGGARMGYEPQVPRLKDGQAEPYHIRAAAEADLAFIAGLYERGSGRYPVACAWDEALWRYELLGKSARNVNRRTLAIVETPAGEPVGFVAHAPHLWQGRLGMGTYELKPGVSWAAVTPSVVRYLWSRGEELAAREPKARMERFGFWLGAEHPAYEVLRERLPHELKPYAWYLRVPDVPGFLRHVAPVLEQRLAGSPLVNHSGELHVSFYRDGVRLAFDGGRLAAVEPWQPTVEKGGDAAFPGLTFLQLVFGYRSCRDLQYAFADCWTSGDGVQTLLDTLFPRQPSDLWPIS